LIESRGSIDAQFFLGPGRIAVRPPQLCIMKLRSLWGWWAPNTALP